MKHSVQTNFFLKLKHFIENGNCLIIFLIWIEMKSITFLTGNSSVGTIYLFPFERLCYH